MVLHVFHADHRGEGESGGEAVERDRGIGARAAGEDGEIEILGELFEHAGARDPLLAQNQAVVAIAEEDGLEVVLHVLEGDVEPAVVADVVGELPIVIPAALILVLLNLLAGGVGAGEVLDGLRDAFAIAFGDVHQDAIHVEDDEFLGQSIGSRSLPAR